MTAAVFTAGAVLVKTGTGSASALESLGYTANGVEIDEELKTLDVPGDENGGDEGVPIDIQNLGQIHHIRMELTKFDIAVIAKITPRVLGGTNGEQGTIGALFAAGTLTYRVLLTGTNFTRNYLKCIPRGVREVVGTKFTRWVLEWDAYPSAGVLWNSTTSG